MKVNKILSMKQTHFKLTQVKYHMKVCSINVSEISSSDLVNLLKIKEDILLLLKSSSKVFWRLFETCHRLKIISYFEN